jgi:type I restriction enzyme S subunit
MSKLSMNRYTLRDLIQIKNGRDHKELGEGNIPVFGSGGIMRFADKAIYNNESILLPRKGTLSNIQYVKKPFWTVDTIYYTIVNKKLVNAFFLFNYIKLLDLSWLNSGTGVPSMTFDAYYDLEVYLPELSTQQKIASVLSSLDSKIELNNRINAELEAMAKTLYDYWFVQFDFPNEKGKPYKSSGGKMVWNEELKREVPEGWENGLFGNYCTSTGGYAFKSDWWTDKGVAVAKIKDIKENYTLDTSDLARVDVLDKNIDAKFMAKAGDVLIAMTGATVGKYAIVPITDYPIYVNQRVGYFNLGNDPTKKLPFLINSMNQSYFRNAIFTLANGAAQPNISNEQINNIQLLVPDKKIIESYNEMFQPYYKKILNNQLENQKLTELRDWLLPMLMNGQVKVG